MQGEMSPRRDEEQDTSLPVLRNDRPPRLYFIFKLRGESELTARLHKHRERLQSCLDRLQRIIGFLCKPAYFRPCVADRQHARKRVITAANRLPIEDGQPIRNLFFSLDSKETAVDDQQGVRFFMPVLQVLRRLVPGNIQPEKTLIEAKNI